MVHRRALRVAVTRAAAQADDLAARIEALGCEPVSWPLIAIEPIGDEPIDPTGYDWVVVTSPNGAAELARRLTTQPRRVAAIGPGTAAALRAHALDPALVPRESTQEGLLAELPAEPGRVLLAAAEGARRLLVDELGADFLPLYRTVELLPAETPDVDLVLLASPSAARALARTAARDARVVVIGPQTASAARELGLDVAAEAGSHDLDGLVASLERVLVETARYRAAAMAPLITFLSDFGLADDFVGTCHGVVATIAPDARVIDITHGIRPGRVLQGALTLANTLPYMPAGIHLAVVDPGVGSGRRALALRDAEGRLYVGPDNGLLLLAADRFGGVAAAHELANSEYALQPVSRTFHGRDLFAPAAAHLANGVELAALGPAIDPDTLVRLDIRAPEIGRDRIRATALAIDRFGNVALNVRRDELAVTDLGAGTRLELTCHGEHVYALAARTFADAPPGQLILYDDSYGSLALAVSGGSAAQLLRAEEGTEIVLELGTP